MSKFLDNKGLTYLWENVKSYIDSKLTEQENLILDKICSVGEILITTREGNPSTWLGIGTWEQLPEGFVLISAGSTYLANQQYGQSTITLTTEQMPRHSHEGTTDMYEDSHNHDIGALSHDSLGNWWAGNVHGGAKNDGACGIPGFLLWQDSIQDNHTYLKKPLDTSNNHSLYDWFNSSNESSIHTHSFTTTGTGGKNIGTTEQPNYQTQPIDVHQPSIAYYFWRRVT